MNSVDPNALLSTSASLLRRAIDVCDRFEADCARTAPLRSNII